MIRKYISPEDFTDRAVSDGCGSFISSSMRKARSIPARDHKSFYRRRRTSGRWRALFHTKIQELTTKEEQEKALKGDHHQSERRCLWNGRCGNFHRRIWQGLQRMMKERKAARKNLRKLHISID